MVFQEISEHVSTVRTGTDLLMNETADLIRNKQIGILTNHTGRLSSGLHIIEAIIGSGLASVRALYGPEHGIFGNTPDGKVVDNASHPHYNIPIYSLYGKTHKPTREMLTGIDVLLCDIQDIGARFYTYVSTIALALEAAAENGIRFIVLDRPNPIRGVDCDGPVRVLPLRSFVSWMPLPVLHGMTIGELTRLWNNEGQLANSVHGDLEVVCMQGWKRTMWYDETGLQWISPSPNMQRLSTAIVYPGLCFVEGTSLSEGRGTSSPFELIGAPWVDPERVLKHLDHFSTPGITFAPAEFTPRDIPGVASKPKYEGRRCFGVRLSITQRDVVQPVRLGVAVLAAFKRAHPLETELRHRRFDILTGSASVRKKLDQNVDPDEICREWTPDLEEFSQLRKKYLLY